MNSPVYVHMQPGSAPPRLTITGPFQAILVVEADVTAEWQDRVADWLIQSGCRYVMAWGRRCEEWHDSIDYSNLRAFDFGEIPDDDLVMTTWHAQEPLKDVFWFSEHAAAHPTLSLEMACIVHIAPTERSAELLEMFHGAQNEDE